MGNFLRCSPDLKVHEVERTDPLVSYPVVTETRRGNGVPPTVLETKDRLRLLTDPPLSLVLQGVGGVSIPDDRALTVGLDDRCP